LRAVSSLILAILILVMAGISRGADNQLMQDDKLKSRAELTDYQETSRYEDVLRFISELQRRSPLVRVESFARTSEGRDLPLMTIADPPVTRPQDLRHNPRTVVFIMANIHAGEVEGKEAMFAIARRIALGDLKPVLANLIVLIAPIYNADGNEKISVQNRTLQNGPLGGVGTRENAKGLDLNRDYMKLESPEAQGLVRLFNRWDPHLTVDLHTTNGSYHGYHLTYAPPLNPNADPGLIAFEREKMLPAITEAVLKEHHFRTYFYGNFATRESLGRELDAFHEAEGKDKVWRTFDQRPRFGNNYLGLRNRLAILSEAYSYLDLRGRVAVTAAFVEEILKYSSNHAAEIAALAAKLDAETVSENTGPGGVEFALKPLPGEVNILVGEVKKIMNPRSGKEMLAMVEDHVVPTRMPDYGLFTATRRVKFPRAYLLRPEPDLAPAINNLRNHGLQIEELTEPLSAKVESFMIDSVSRSEREFQGHREVKLKGHAQTETLTFPQASLLIRTGQPLGRLAFYLLEPESDDGLTAWNFFDARLSNGKPYPVVRLTEDISVSSRTKEN
jgi:hypothetical protein